MFEQLADANYWRDVIAFTVALHHAGYNMIPQEGWVQYVVSWASVTARSGR